MSLLDSVNSEAGPSESEETPDEALDRRRWSHRLSKWKGNRSGENRSIVVQEVGLPSHTFKDDRHYSYSSASQAPDAPAGPASSLLIGLPPEDAASSESSKPSDRVPDAPVFPMRPENRRASTTFDEAFINGLPQSGIPRAKRLSPRQINKRLSLLMMMCELLRSNFSV